MKNKMIAEDYVEELLQKALKLLEDNDDECFDEKKAQLIAFIREEQKKLYDE